MPVKFDIGDRLTESLGGGKPFSAGRIVATADSSARSDVVYLLLLSDAGEFTVYAALRDALGKPWMPRKVPGSDFRVLAAAALGEIDLPSEKEQPSKAAPVVTRQPPVQKHYGPAPSVDIEDEDDVPSEEPNAFPVEPMAGVPQDEPVDSLFCPGLDVLFEVAT